LFFVKEVFKLNKNFFFFLGFFFLLFFLTSINYFFFKNAEFYNFYKSIFFFRFLFLYLIVGLLIKKNKFEFELFLISVTIVLLSVSIDIIIQYIFGYNLFGFKTSVNSVHFSGAFGSELIAGGYIVRFYFLVFALTILIFRKKPKILNTYFLIINALLFISTIFSGNKMPLLIYYLGLILGIVFIKHYRSLFIKNLISCIVISFIFFSYNDNFNLQINRLYVGIEKIVIVFHEKIFITPSSKKENLDQEKINNKIQKNLVKDQSHHYAIYITGVHSAKKNLIIGGGIKSFPKTCLEFKKIGSCGNHPHNYYLEIVNDTGLIGLILFLIILFIVFKNYYNSITYKNFSSIRFIHLCTVITLVLEIFPIRSTGSFFSTGNATFIFLFFGILINLNRVSKEIDFYRFKKKFNF